MIRTFAIWHIIQKYAPKRQWVSSEEIYDIVESHGKLDREDLEPQSPKSRIPKWKLRVRNVLVDRKNKGKLRWVKNRNTQPV